ncbi:MAG: tRNA lysidine(34) synthetase TilS [Candidatus Binataceae bacterium]
MSLRSKKHFLGAVERSLARAQVRTGCSILIALSGGPDSVALLDALRELGERSGYRLAAAHLNHALRGDESDRDESFCRELCARLAIDLIAERAAGLDPMMPNLEEAARHARHSFLDRAANQVGADYIATGHHADDQAETVLMRMLRGSGIAGLSAMAESGPGRIIRPLLALSRNDILEYLRAIGATFVTDSSNLSTAMLRNRIRHQLLPALDRDYAPGASRRLAELASEMRALDSFVSRAAAVELAPMTAAGDGLDISRFGAIDPALQAPVLRLYLAAQLGDLRRVNRAHLTDIVSLCLAGPANGEIALPGGWRAVREYGRLKLRKASPNRRPRFSVPIAFEGTTEIVNAGFAFDTVVIGAGDVVMPADSASALFDVKVIAAHGLTARNFRPGDRIRPMGLGGTRKVKDVFIDRKLPPGDRARFPVVVSGDEIVWLPGLVRGEGAAVGTASETVLRIDARRMS